MFAGAFKRPILTGFLAVLLVSADYTVPATGVINYPIFHKGMTYVTWTTEGFSTPKSDESLRSMADAGISCAAIVPTWYQEKFDSTAIMPTEKTPSDSSLRHAIRKARENGMMVMVKPHIDLEDQADNTRSDIGFQTDGEWEKWFSNYTKFISHYARIAEEEHAEFFCIGTELSFASTRVGSWKNKVIPAVRKIFSGHITYAANWDEYSSVQFWGDLDYAGIDAYFPLSGTSNPPLSVIKEGWKKWLSEIEAWQAGVNKPVIFTECGYCSSDIAAMKPWEEAVSGSPNMDIQANCYKAVFETFWDKPWFFGTYWWSWNTYARSGGPGNRHFTPQNKLALEQLKLWYGRPTDDKFGIFEKQMAMRERELEERIRLQPAGGKE
ncbi:MAG: hypothetical protein WC515_00870 [Candidatus Omnitrophota bacterium]